jgi:hypothetical protein
LATMRPRTRSIISNNQQAAESGNPNQFYRRSRRKQRAAMFSSQALHP